MIMESHFILHLKTFEEGENRNMHLPLLQVTGLSKAINKEVLLHNVTFEVYKGETVGLIGANGAGKSLLVKHLSGLLQPDSGEIQIDGIPVVFKNAKEAQEAGIITLYQNINLMEDLSVAENIMVNHLPLNWYGKVQWKILFQKSDDFMNF